MQLAKLPISGITEEQWEKIEACKQRWIDVQTRQGTQEEIQDAVNSMYHRMGEEPPILVVLPSPQAAIEAATALRLSTGDPAWLTEKSAPERIQEILEEASEEERTDILKKSRDSGYWSSWWSSYAGWFESGAILGVAYNEADYEDFMKWCTFVPYSIQYQDVCFVSQHPITISWKKEVLHCDTGMAVQYADGWGLWAIDGSIVDEQIVMRPQTQTLEQIHSEKHGGVQRIRIQRFGWFRYLKETQSTVLSEEENATEETYEVVVQTPVGKVLLTHCPTTGKLYSLPYDQICRASEEHLQGSGTFGIWGNIPTNAGQPDTSFCKIIGRA